MQEVDLLARLGLEPVPVWARPGSWLALLSLAAACLVLAWSRLPEETRRRRATWFIWSGLAGLALSQAWMLLRSHQGAEALGRMGPAALLEHRRVALWADEASAAGWLFLATTVPLGWLVIWGHRDDWRHPLSFLVALGGLALAGTQTPLIEARGCGILLQEFASLPRPASTLLAARGLMIVDVVALGLLAHHLFRRKPSGPILGGTAILLLCTAFLFDSITEFTSFSFALWSGARHPEPFHLGQAAVRAALYTGALAACVAAVRWRPSAAKA